MLWTQKSPTYEPLYGYSFIAQHFKILIGKIFEICARTSQKKKESILVIFF